MRHRPIIAALLALLPALAAAQTVQSGQWEIVTTVKEAAAPKAPPGAVPPVGATHKVSRCLTTAEANRGPQDIIKDNKQCRFARYSKKNGKFDSQMLCSRGDGTMTATSKGTYTATTFSTTAHMTMTGAQPMTLTTLAEGKRVGACAP